MAQRPYEPRSRLHRARHRPKSGEPEDRAASMAPTHPLPASSDVARRGRPFWRELPALAFVAIVLTIFVQAFVARLFVIPSASMEQTLQGCIGCTNDRVIVDRVTYRFTEPSTGDVVVFEGPPEWQTDGEATPIEQPSSNNPVVRTYKDVTAALGATSNETDFVKRIVAVGGQTVACCDKQNRVLVDGRPITEPYLYYRPDRGSTQSEFPPVRVPVGQLWVMGDNRNNSADSRVHGPVPIQNVIGKVRAVVLPLSRWRTVRTVDSQSVPLG